MYSHTGFETGSVYPATVKMGIIGTHGVSDLRLGSACIFHSRKDP